MMLRPKSTTDIRRLHGISTVADPCRATAAPRQQVGAPRLVVVPGPAAGGEQPLLVPGEPRHRQVVPVPPEREHAAGLEHPERLGDRALRVGPVERLRVGHQVEAGRRASGSALPSPTTGRTREVDRDAQHPQHARPGVDRRHRRAAAGEARDAMPVPAPTSQTSARSSGWPIADSSASNSCAG